MIIVTLSFFFHPIIELFLVVKEEELIFHHGMSAFLCFGFILISLLHSLDIIVILLKLHVSLLLFLHKVLTHLPQMILQKFFVSHPVDANPLAKANHISLIW